MIVKELRGKYFDISVADLALNPSITQSGLSFESALVAPPSGHGISFGVSGAGVLVPSFSGKHLRLTFEGAASQDSAHTDSVLSFGINNGPMSTGTTITAALAESSSEAEIKMIWDLYVPEYSVYVVPIGVFAPWDCMFVNADGSVARSTGAIPGFSDSFIISPVFSISSGGSGLPTVGVRTKKLLIEFAD